MRFFFDTSVLVAACREDNVAHPAAFRRLQKSTPAQGFCAAHSLAEFYPVMTRLPVRPPVTPEQAMLLLTGVLQRVTVVALTSPEYRATIEEVSEAGLAGGITYDALILACARKVDARVVYSLNPKHFRRINPGWTGRIQSP